MPGFGIAPVDTAAGPEDALPSVELEGFILPIVDILNKPPVPRLAPIDSAARPRRNTVLAAML